MNSNVKTLVLNLGDHPKEMTADQFADVQTVQHPYAPKLTYYTAQDNSGKIVGSVMVSPEDRKAQAALVGGWIAAGYQIDVKTFKDLSKILREEQKAIDDAAKPKPAAPALGNEPASSAAPVAAAPAAPASTPDGEKSAGSAQPAGGEKSADGSENASSKAPVQGNSDDEKF